MAALSPAVRAEPTHMYASPALTSLYQRYSEMVFRTAWRVTGNPADAEDALQTVFLRVLNRGSGLDLAAVPEGYFRRAATNAALDILRGRVSRAESQFDEGLPPAARESPALLKEQLRRAVARLDEQDGEMFLLRYIEGLSNGELGELFGMETNSVAVRLHRIRQRLQVEMQR